jgi:hypothetical protein
VTAASNLRSTFVRGRKKIRLGSASVHIGAAKLVAVNGILREGDNMQRRDLLRFASGLVGIAAGLTVLAASANAAPLAPASAVRGLQASHGGNVESAVVTQADVDQAKPVQVHWHGHWHRRHWGWHHRHWHRHHWHHRHW